MFKFKIYLLALFSVAFLVLIQTAEGAEIQYGHVAEVLGTKLHIQYKGPGGQQNFICDIGTLECEAFGTSTPPSPPLPDRKHHKAYR